MRTHFHNKNCALSLTVIMRFKATRKWPIYVKEKQNDRQTRFVPHAFAQSPQRKHKIRLALSHCRPS